MKISKYKDIRGLPIAQSSIDDWLKPLGKTEEEFVAFIGEDCAKIDGYIIQLLQYWHPMDRWLTGQWAPNVEVECLDGLERYVDTANLKHKEEIK